LCFYTRVFFSALLIPFAYVVISGHGSNPSLRVSASRVRCRAAALGPATPCLRAATPWASPPPALLFVAPCFASGGSLRSNSAYLRASSSLGRFVAGLFGRGALGARAGGAALRKPRMKTATAPNNGGLASCC